MASTFETLPELLFARATDTQYTAEFAFLDTEGRIAKSLTYADLLEDASHYASRLLAAGLTSNDVVLSSFPDHESHIRLFWACCLAGIPICPLPVLHPDPARHAILFNHLQTLFHGPTLIASAEVTQRAHALVPELKVLVPEELPAGRKDMDGVFPKRCPSPDEPVCFMLTSGSTSNSKAVLLRNSNILSSVYGKIQCNDTTEKSRFLNWIAFDHVACVTEVHIHALAANASQYHVSPAAVVSNPRNFLEWCSNLRVTYTFSPNFLLAQLLRDISAMPLTSVLDLSNLQVLLSGGEAVPVATAIAVADLLESFGAPRNALRSGFGMSETAAACIYDTRPTPGIATANTPKYLSIGKCCSGVEMRVVVPTTGKRCPPNQPGQLQLKGPTVFTEYRGNPQVTKESFTEDGWFITGDLAQIDVDGNLFLVGRDKDCVNVNGVKHPTQDIEKAIQDANIQGVVPSLIFVCPMRLAHADTETYGVFYQHEVAVEKGLDASQVYSVIAANRAVKTAATMFCSQAPYIVLPLPRAAFARTALGKVSRAQLSKSYLQGKWTALEESMHAQENLSDEEDQESDLTSPVEITVVEAIAETFSLDPSTLRRSQNMFEIGASSMHLLRVKQVLQQRLELPDISTIELLKRSEIGALCDYMSELYERKGSSVPTTYQPLVCFNSSGKEPPLFLIHPGAGEVLVFVGLARELGHDRPIYGIRARGLDPGTQRFDSWDEMVGLYTSAIEECYPDGPYFIAGYSMGTAVAFSIVKNLEAKGKKVSWLGLLDMVPDLYSDAFRIPWVELILLTGVFLDVMAVSSWDTVYNKLVTAFPELLKLGGSEPEHPHGPVDLLFENCDQDRLARLGYDIQMFRRLVASTYFMFTSGRAFIPEGRVKSALTTVFCSARLPSVGPREEFTRERLTSWEKYSGEAFEAIDVAGEHHTILNEEYIKEFAEKMKGALARAQKMA